MSVGSGFADEVATDFTSQYARVMVFAAAPPEIGINSMSWSFGTV